jgi:RecA/RadA recombinase
MAIANIEKQFGKGSIMRLGEKKVVDVPAISTSCLSLDAAIGIGGVPRVESWRSTDRNPAAKQRSPFT